MTCKTRVFGRLTARTVVHAWASAAAVWTGQHGANFSFKVSCAGMASWTCVIVGMEGAGEAAHRPAAQQRPRSPPTVSQLCYIHTRTHSDGQNVRFDSSKSSRVLCSHYLRAYTERRPRSYLCGRVGRRSVDRFVIHL